MRPLANTFVGAMAFAVASCGAVSVCHDRLGDELELARRTGESAAVALGTCCTAGYVTASERRNIHELDAACVPLATAYDALRTEYNAGLHVPCGRRTGDAGLDPRRTTILRQRERATQRALQPFLRGCP